MDEWLVIVGVILVGLVLLGLVIWIGMFIFAGAVVLFAWASQQGFIGVAAYFACWVFLFPFMLIASAIGGFFSVRSLQTDEQSRLDVYEGLSQAEYDEIYGEDVMPLSEYEKNELSKRGF